MSPVIPPRPYPFKKRSNYKYCFVVCFMVFGDILRKQIFVFRSISSKGIIETMSGEDSFFSFYNYCFYFT